MHDVRTVAENAAAAIMAKAQLPLMEAVLSTLEGVSLGDICADHAKHIEPLIRSVSKNITELQRLAQGTPPPKAGVLSSLHLGDRAP